MNLHPKLQKSPLLILTGISLILVIVSPAKANLLVNAGGESGNLSGWTAGGAEVAVVSSYILSGGTVYPAEGSYFFSFAAIPGSYQELVQTGTDPAIGNTKLKLVGNVRTENMSADDFGIAVITVFDQYGVELATASSPPLTTTPFVWGWLDVELVVPPEAVSWELKLTGTREFGTNINVFYDDLSLVLDAYYDDVFINEIDVNTPGTDTAEFVELYGTPNRPLDGKVLVFYNGTDDASYNLGGQFTAIDLDGFTFDANGFFLVGNVQLSPDIVFSNSSLQNGPDAVALYEADGSDFPGDTPVTTLNLLDAVVYDTSDNDDSGLLVLIPGQPQVDENANGNSDIESMQRSSDGAGGARVTTEFLVLPPTPRAPNTAVSAVLDLPPTVSVSVYPNPFNPQTTIAFDLPKQTAVSLRVFDVSGRLVRVLVDGEIIAEGRQEAVWNGRDDSGRQVSSGTYFYRLEAGEYSETRRMALIK